MPDIFRKYFSRFSEKLIFVAKFMSKDSEYEQIRSGKIFSGKLPAFQFFTHTWITMDNSFVLRYCIRPVINKTNPSLFFFYLKINSIEKC